MYLRFWGVRGASVSTSPACLGTGGNTPCVEVRDANGDLIVLDAGIGLYWLGKSLLAGPHGRGKGEVTLLLSHTHWDHIQGFPFFVPAFIPGNVVRVYGGGSNHIDQALEGQMNPTYSPLASLTNMGARIEVHQLEDLPATLHVGTLQVKHATLTNGRSNTVGYRIEDGPRAMCYLAELSHPEGGLQQAALDLARGADLVVHEAFYTEEERRAGGLSLAGPTAPPSSGHSSLLQATELARAAGAKRLLYFYHHPDREDAALAALLEQERSRLAALGHPLQVDLAREGVELEV